MEFDDLYQEIILDHYKKPRNKVPLDHISEDHVFENPTCGDAIKLQLQVNAAGRVERIEFDGSGCAISMASASMMSELLQGKSVEQAILMIDQFTKCMRNEGDLSILEEWGEIEALKGVIRYPVRIKCATLAWHALKQTLEHR